MACFKEGFIMVKRLTWRIWILIIALALSILSISPSFGEGVRVDSVQMNSSAFESGLRQGQVITAVDGREISTIEDYVASMEKFPSDERLRTTFTTNEGDIIIFSNTTPEITVGEIPSTNIRFGLDIDGGARALVKPEQRVSSSEIEDLIAVTSERLNVYGLTEVVIRPVSDLSGENFMLVEIAGATPAELEELIAQQGKFEAKIGNETVFVGGEKDISSVCRNDASCSGIESCFAVEGGEACRFAFVIYLSEEAAQRHADITSDLAVNTTEQGRYLEEKLDLYLDDNLVDSLFISEDLKGRATTQIRIQGSGTGATRQEAVENAQEEMQKLQTVLITGSLPYKLEIVKLDTISPILGERFVYSILFAGLGAILAVALIVFVRYRKIKSSLALLLTSFSEVIIILGIASLINWNLDLPSIAGILAVIGTGVDQQIVILDESKRKDLSIKERLKRALFIVVSAYFTSFVSLLPLYWAGAGLLKGFAVTTIIGITSAVLITRPAFADIIKKIEE
jgi:preprotein translocase subunit SecD